jgi:RES domain-containing protein
MTWTGTAFRHTAKNREPLSGQGAALLGGRWNAVGISCVYLADPRECCIAELRRQLATQPANVRFPQAVHAVSVDGLAVVDLRSASALAEVGLVPDDITADDHTACQLVGAAAAYLGLGGVLAQSATGAGDILAAYLGNLRPTQLLAIDSAEIPDVRSIPAS